MIPKCVSLASLLPKRGAKSKSRAATVRFNRTMRTQARRQNEAHLRGWQQNDVICASGCFITIVKRTKVEIGRFTRVCGDLARIETLNTVPFCPDLEA